MTISGMKYPARETTATNAQVGNLSDELYITFSDSLFKLYIKSVTAIETNIRIWNMSQKAGENSTAWGARSLRAMMCRLKKDVADCTRHKDFMKEKELGSKGETLVEEYAHTPYVTQAYLDATMQYLRGRVDLPTWHTLLIDGITAGEDEKNNASFPYPKEEISLRRARERRLGFPSAII